MDPTLSVSCYNFITRAPGDSPSGNTTPEGSADPERKERRGKEKEKKETEEFSGSWLDFFSFVFFPPTFILFIDWPA